MPAPSFGLFFPQVGVRFETVRERALLCDRLAYHSIWFVDHMWSRGLKDLDHLEAWTLMSATAAVTERLHVGSLVLSNSYRSPALLAKMAASLDNISNGRLILGLGAGWMEEEYEAYGFPYPSTRVRLEQLEEALVVIDLMLREESASFQGKYFSITEAVNRPKSMPRVDERPRLPILVGGAGEKKMLRLVAQHADIWNCPNNAAADLANKIDILRRHCDAVDRNPDEIEISEQCVVVIGETERDLDRRLESARSTVGSVFDIESAGLIGTAPQLIDAIERRRQQGVTLFTMLFGDMNQPESIQLFAEEVMPAFAG